MLIDDAMPSWEVRSQHEIVVQARAADTYAAIRSANLGAHPLVRALLGLRALPAALANGRMSQLRERASRPISLSDLELRGFRVVAESAPEELLIGVEGAFWAMSGGLRPVTAGAFLTPVPLRLARAAWSFTVQPMTATSCLLRTETRVVTGGASARWRFRLYWAAVGWGSCLIRRLILRAIKAAAEGNTRRPFAA